VYIFYCVTYCYSRHSIGIFRDFFGMNFESIEVGRVDILLANVSFSVMEWDYSIFI